MVKANDMNRPKRFLSGFWSVSVHPVTFVVLSVLWCVDLAVGSIAAYFNDPVFWQKMDAYPLNLWLREIAPRDFPASLWVYILAGLSCLMVLSLLLCTVNWFGKRRKHLKSFGEVLVHLGFLFIFAGFVGGSALGHRTSVLLKEGQVQSLEDMEVSIELRGFELVRSPRGRPLDTVSELAVYVHDRMAAKGKVSTNHPLIKGSTVIYPPDDYEVDVAGALLGTSTDGVVTAWAGQDVLLTDGRKLSVGGALQEGQRRGGAVGPGILLLLQDREGRVAASSYLSHTPGMKSTAFLGGVKVTLGQLLRSTTGVFRVHHDPGIWVVIAGSLILAAGTLWALAGFLGLIKDGEKN
jgi:hypothetical protein